MGMALVVLLLIAMGCFYVYVDGMSSMGDINKPDDNPYFITEKPMVIRNLLLPEGTKISYGKRYFWEKHEQKRPLNESDITQISFPEGETINWGGVPITSITKFFNSEMKGFTVYADFNQLRKDKETQFSNLWQSCNDGLGIIVKNGDDWSFNKENILGIESCGVLYQRYFTKDIEQELFLDNLFDALKKIEDSEH
ncbi:hypothetical protein J0X14_04860 [Muricauda sp. CAU 1633]|uniref:hypothetical protein n=1 Tax=Allomuricauda sp. CAU 1633 TaxID=2816036 RepID=UPI001A901A1C|nr:hypothetical protein [Muricauda sp. CAU 1633]MBO0321619.1 hypothetical protein [Muricauda sp. CAU 1633]